MISDEEINSFGRLFMSQENEKSTFGLVVQVQAIRIKNSPYQGAMMIPLVNTFHRAYILQDSSDSNGRVRASIGADISSLLDTLAVEQTVWEETRARMNET